MNTFNRNSFRKEKLKKFWKKLKKRWDFFFNNYRDFA